MGIIKLYNGFEIPDIGYGTFPQKQTLTENVPIAFDCGYRMVDTSDNYLNEEYVGKGLSKTRQDDIVVISKFSQPFRTRELEKCFYESREKLGGKIDIYLLHWPYPFLWEKQWRRMEDLYLRGEIKAIGVCNFDEGYLRRLLKICRVKPMINQFERHPMFQQHGLVKLCEKNDIKVISYSPVARMSSSLHCSPVLHSLTEKYGRSINQIILRWHIDTGCVPIPASASEVHIKENIGIQDFCLSKKDVIEINNLESGNRIRYNPRTRFDFRQTMHMLKYRIMKL